jgi:hypothetical protein
VPAFFQVAVLAKPAVPSESSVPVQRMRAERGPPVPASAGNPAEAKRISALAGALTASALLHGMLLVALSGAVAGGTDAPSHPSPMLSARLVAASPEVPSEERVQVADPVRSPRPHPPVARPPVPLPKVPAVAPRAVDPPPLASVVVNVDADGPLEAILQNAVPGNAAEAQRVPLELGQPPGLFVPVEKLRGSPQRRIRALVGVHSDGGLELLATDEYDDELVFAIREALDRTRARPQQEGAGVKPGWAIVEFWFELPASRQAR